MDNLSKYQKKYDQDEDEYEIILNYKGNVNKLIDNIIYGNIDKTPWISSIKEHCQTIDVEILNPDWLNSLNEEQVLRMNIAATVKKFLTEVIK